MKQETKQAKAKSADTAPAPPTDGGGAPPAQGDALSTSGIEGIDAKRLAGGEAKEVKTPAADRDNILRVEGLCKSIGKRAIVDGVTLQIGAGQVVGLFGPNGAGKTTTFYMIAGILPADAGRILLDGADITRLSLSERARRRINYLAQESSIFRYLSVHDNIYAILEYRRDLDDSQRRHECARLLNDFGLQQVRDTLGIRLSGGERRRAEIARLLAANPRIVLMDEPFSGVDPKSVKETQAIIRQLRDKGIAVLITDHNFRESLRICDYAYIFNLGRVVAQGLPAEVVNDATVREVYLGDSAGEGDNSEDN